MRRRRDAVRRWRATVEQLAEVDEARVEEKINV
jgi:hypothetical protein